MLQEAKDLQNSAVTKLVAEIKLKDDIVFKAPTGSGKTHMMADFMNRVLEGSNEIVFLVSSLSKGDLARQNFNKFCEYNDKGSFPLIKPYLISSDLAGEERLFIPVDYNVYLLPRDLYKKGGRLMEGSMENFLQNLTLHKAFGGQGKTIYLIKDECHVATSNLDTLSNAYFTKTINFSATPNLERGQTPDIEIKNDDAVAAKLIKNIELGEDTDTVADAINKFESIKAQYRNLLGVNPCLIIQISNKNKADYELNNIILPELNKIEHQELKWMLIVDDYNLCDTNDTFKVKKLPVSRWKSYARENTATIDIIIFKMVITEGWDIPRACMLYQVRDSQSKQLDEQVMGRVRRNPRLLDFENLSTEAQDLAMTAWIWGIIPVALRRSIAVRLWDETEDITSAIKIKTTKLKPLTKKVSFDLKSFLLKQPLITTHKSIFDLGRKINKAEKIVQDACYEYADTYTKWWDIAENIDAFIEENNKFICDYAQSMEVAKDENGNDAEVSFALSSHYTDSDYDINIDDWVWRRRDGKKKISFDSRAEREWANILKDLSAKDNLDNISQRAVKRIIVGKRNPKGGMVDLFNKVEPEKINENNIYLWGKNFLINSDIKFEYYMGTLHSSYPDFVMKDSFERVHIFEVKSINISNAIHGTFDNNIYKEKIAELKKCYKHASTLTNQIFYLPVMKDDTWHITQFMLGQEHTLTEEQFIEFVRRP